MQLDKEDIAIYKALLPVVYSFYPVNIDIMEPAYLQSEEIGRLVEAVRSHRSMSNWDSFLQDCKMLNTSTGISDQTTYSYFAPCYKASIAIQIDNVKYHVRVYISMISNYYVYKVNQMYEMEQFDESAFFQLNKQDQRAFLLKQRELSNDYEHEYINDCPEELSTYFESINKLIDCHFSYMPLPVSLLDVVVPNISTNLKPFQSVTLFDALFTDWEIPA